MEDFPAQSRTMDGLPIRGKVFGHRNAFSGWANPSYYAPRSYYAPVAVFKERGLGKVRVLANAATPDRRGVTGNSASRLPIPI